MIDHMNFDVMLFDDRIASVQLKPANSDKLYVANYIEGFNKQFPPIGGVYYKRGIREMAEVACTS
ncbi:hypothetical protein ACUL41_17480 [Virgibacillus natechei]|uniref:hypothetical protein n=1 Tax=Virgibacillus sp. CBA3643 TaxID=2942278 RepID=UPI0035A3AC22